MIHFEGAPTAKVATPKVEAPVPAAPRKTMAERLAERGIGQRGADVSTAPSTPEDDRLKAMIEAVNEKTAAAGAVAREAQAQVAQEPSGPMSYDEWKKKRAGATESAPVAAAVEAAPVAAPEAAPERAEANVEQKSETYSEDERVKYAEAMRAAALVKRQRMIDDHARAAEERARLRSLPPTPSPVPYLRVAERRPEPMPKIDPYQKINIPGFGEAQILFVDPDEDLMYFATPEERRRVDAQLSRDEGQSSRNAADYSQVIRLTPTEVRRILAEQRPTAPDAQIPDLREESPVRNNVQHLRSRYAS